MKGPGMNDAIHQNSAEVERLSRETAPFGQARLPAAGGGHGMSVPGRTHNELTNPTENAKPNTEFLKGPGTDYLGRLGLKAAHVQEGHNRGMGKSGIHIKASHKGLLHKDLGVPAGSPIPAAKLAKAKNSSNPAVRKRATFAQNAKGWNK